MAKKPKAKAEEQGGESKAAKPSEVRPAITERKLKDLMRAARSANKDTAEINGVLGKKISSAVENDHLHRKAFNVIKMLDRMEPEKLADFLDCFDHYLDISGIEERAKSAPGFNMDPGEGEDEGEDRGNVKPFPKPAEAAE